MVIRRPINAVGEAVSGAVRAAASRAAAMASSMAASISASRAPGRLARSPAADGRWLSDWLGGGATPNPAEAPSPAEAPGLADEALADAAGAEAAAPSGEAVPTGTPSGEAAQATDCSRRAAGDRDASGGATGVIVIDRVSKIFPHPDGSEVQALEEVNLTVGAGEFVTLIGPSGCGKSTLLRLIAGLETATGGRLELDGRAIEGPDAERGLVFQNPFLFPWLNISNNVAFGLRARRVYRRERAQVARYLELVGLGKFGRVYPHHLSGGMAQRASLARALINRPRVLLLDEPLGALDAFTRMNMQDEILRIREDSRVTMIMVTHDVDEAIYLSDRIVVMTPHPGRVETVLTVPFARPRARNNPGFLSLRSRILEILDFAGHLEEPAYQI